MRNRVILLLLMMVTAVSCVKEADVPADAVRTRWTRRRIVVIAPLSESEDYAARLHRTAEWFCQNYHKAQTSLANGVNLDVEWYDENCVSLDSLADAIADDSGVDMVIGPYFSDHLDVVAERLRKTDKAVIAPLASSESVVRRYAVTPTGTVKKPFLWAMAETDISQCEAMLSKVSLEGGKRVCVLSPRDSYGQTFFEWAPFQTEELGLTLAGNVMYECGNTESVEAAMAEALESGATDVVCAASHVDDAISMIRYRNANKKHDVRLLFSDGVMSNALLLTDTDVESVEGVAMYASPSSGFQLSYESRFGVIPTSADCMTYDAFMLAGMSAFYCLENDSVGVNDAIRILTSEGYGAVEGASSLTWDVAGMKECMTNISMGVLPSGLCGATGMLTFDADAYTTRVANTYCHWRVYDGKLATIDYLSSVGSHRVSSLLASWNWQANNIQDFLNEDASVTYGALKSRWALLVCGSVGWFNYRHQADVLNMYHLLKRRGYDDEHIILVTANDVGYASQNIYQGEVRAEVNGTNLLDGVTIDYSTDTLTADDVCDILAGRASLHLPVVLDTDENSNVFVYWTGHGEDNRFLWGLSDAHFTSYMLSDVISVMCSEHRFRKLLFCAEPCFSGSMMDELMGYPGVLGIASATSSEYSFADAYDTDMAVWLSDRFTNNLVSAIDDDADMTYRELYLRLVRHTLGSHVTVFNQSLFGNLYTERCGEFFGN